MDLSNNHPFELSGLLIMKHLPICFLSLTIIKFTFTVVSFVCLFLPFFLFDWDYYRKTHSNSSAERMAVPTSGMIM